MREDDDVINAEQVVLLRAMEEVMFGGRKQQGLVYIVAETSKQIGQTVDIINKLSSDVNGADGIRADIRDIKRELQRMQKTEERLERLEGNGMQKQHLEALQREADLEHESIRKNAEAMEMRLTTAFVEAKLESKDSLERLAADFKDSRDKGPFPSWVWGAVSTVISVIAIVLAKGHV